MEPEIAAAGSVGCIETPRGRLPLAAVSVTADVWGPSAKVIVRQTFVNAFDQPVEASYVFALPDRAAVQKCTSTLGERVIEALLFERGEARQKYADAVEAGHRATLVEEDRPGCFTSSVGNLQPGEHAIIALSYSVELPITDGEVTFRFPLVLAPRFTPGLPLPGASVGAGTASDTNATPDASRVSPPTLAPGASSGVQLSLSVRVHHAGVTPESLRTPLHTVTTLAEPRATLVQLPAGERMDRDFLLRYRLFSAARRSELFLARDAVGDEGTWQLCFLAPPPAIARPLDVVFLLDRSGSMEGWKLETARAALTKMVNTLGPDDRFALFAFDNALASPLPSVLNAASTANRALATTFLAQLTANGGTELARALEKAASISWSGAERDKVVVLITDGQVTNEDELVRIVGKLQGVRLCAVGIDQAVNEGLLRRLAELTGGSVELVESAARLTEAMERIAHTARPPVLADISVNGEGLELIPGQTAPLKAQAAYLSDTLVLRGRFRGPAGGSLLVSGRRTDGSIHREAVDAVGAESDALAALWARATLRALEDRYAAGGLGSKDALRKELVSTSLRFGVLCRFTAFLAVDRDSKVASSEHRVLQPVEKPRGWADAPTAGRYRGGRQAAARKATKTQAGILKGKFGHMSPEQVRGLPLDPRSEVFILAVILWEALSGERLFSGDSDFTTLEAVRTAKLPDVMPPGIPPAFEPVLRRALARDVDHRYANGAELADALEALRVDCPPAPSLGDFVTATCPTEVDKWQKLIARALTHTPPADGRCVLVEKFNQGGMTTDWIAVRAGAGGTTELLLVERLWPTLAEDDEFVSQYLEDVSYGASHPGLVELLGVNGDISQIVIAHELVRGVDLQRLLRLCGRQRPMPARLALELIATVGRTLAFMNDLPDDGGNLVGSVHRSLSPTKILISFEGVVKVAGINAPPAERYRPPTIAIDEPAAAPRKPIVAPPPPPAPAAPEERSLTTRLLEFFKPRRDQFWK